MRDVASIEEAAKYPGYVRRQALSGGGLRLYYPGDTLPATPVIDTAIKSLPDAPGRKDVRYFGAVEGKVKNCTQAVLLSLQEQGVAYIPAGNWLFESPITYDNSVSGSADPYSSDKYAEGVQIFGDGMGKTQLFCGFSAPSFSGAAALGLINLPAVTTDKYRLGARISDLAIYPAGSIAKTHGILMSANFLPRIERVKVQLMPGSGFYSPLRTDLMIGGVHNTDFYQNSNLVLDQFYAKACGQYGFFGESGGGCAGTSIRSSWFYDCYRSGIRIGGVLGEIDGCAIANCGVAGSLAGIDTGGIIIDNLAGAEARNFSIKRCEFESNHNFNLWVRSCFGLDSFNLRLNSQHSADGNVSLKSKVHVLLGGSGTAVRAAKFNGDVSKSNPTGPLSALPLSMYKLQGADVAGVEIYEPTGTAGEDNSSGLVLLDTSISTGTLDGVRMRRQGVWSQTTGGG